MDPTSGDGAAVVVGGDPLSAGELPTGLTLSVEELGELIGSGGAGQAPVQAEAEEGSWTWEEDDEEDEEEWSEEDDEEEGPQLVMASHRVAGTQA